jgi:hypothetical protein
MTAYKLYLIKASDGILEALSGLIIQNLISGNPMAFDLIEELTTSEHITPDAVLECATNLLKQYEDYTNGQSQKV